MVSTAGVGSEWSAITSQSVRPMEVTAYVLRREEIELTKSVRGPPGRGELSAKSRMLRAPARRGSNDGSATLKSTRQAEQSPS